MLDGKRGAKQHHKGHHGWRKRRGTATALSPQDIQVCAAEPVCRVRPAAQPGEPSSLPGRSLAPPFFCLQHAAASAEQGATTAAATSPPRASAFRKRLASAGKMLRRGEWRRHMWSLGPVQLPRLRDHPRFNCCPLSITPPCPLSLPQRAVVMNACMCPTRTGPSLGGEATALCSPSSNSSRSSLGWRPGRMRLVHRGQGRWRAVAHGRRSAGPCGPLLTRRDVLPLSWQNEARRAPPSGQTLELQSGDKFTAC